MDAMTPAEHSLVPFNYNLPSEDDLGIGLGHAEKAPASLRHPLRSPGMMTFLWLLVCGLQAITAIYHVVYDGPGARLLAYAAIAGAIVLLLGAGILGYQSRRLAAAKFSAPLASLLLLLAFTVPTAQLLLTLVASQDLSYSIYVLLLVLGYALLAGSTESLLLYLTITLAAWCACALRCPPGAWIGYMLPWMGTVGMAILIHSRSNVRPPVGEKTRQSSSVIDVPLDGLLRAAQSDRDRAESELHRVRSEQARLARHAGLLSDLGHVLSQDMTLQELGRTWLHRLLIQLPAEHASIWIIEAEKPPQVAVSAGLSMSLDNPAVAQALRASITLENGSMWSCPLDVGMPGNGVLLVQTAQGYPAEEMQTLLRTASAMLGNYLRCQLAESESDVLTEEIHQLRKGLQQAEQAQAHAAETTDQVTHWKSEAQRWQQLLETAQSEHDTLTQMLDETESELKALKAAGNPSERIRQLEAKLAVAENASMQQAQLENKLKASESDRLSAEASWDAAEKQLQQAQNALQQSQKEAREAQAEWERETQTVSLLTSALGAIPEAVLVFSDSGQLLYENMAAREFRGNTRHHPGEHPLWKHCIKSDVPARQQPWTVDYQWAQGKTESYAIQISPLRHEKHLDGFVMIASHRSVKPDPKPLPSEDVEAGPRFFGALAQTLEPPLSQLIQHADGLLQASDDQEVRRRALVGILQQGRYVRRLLTQAVDFAELQSGQLLVAASSCSPWTIVQEAVAQLQPAADEKGLVLMAAPGGPLPATILTDADRLRQLLRHLITQDIRTATAGSVVLRIGLEQRKPSQSGPGKLRIEIDSTQAERTDVNDSRSIALQFDRSMIQKQIEALGIQLHVNEEKQVSLVLPVSSMEMLNLVPLDRLRVDEQSQPSMTEYALSQGKVLVVVDGQESQRVTAYQLERMGLRSEVLAEGERALERVKENRFDIVLWDAGKQDKSPVQAAHELRTHHYQGGILAIGHHGQLWPREEFLEAGGDGVLARPIVPAVWRNTLDGYLTSKLNQTTVTEQLLSLYHADREFGELIRLYVGRLPGQLAEMRSSSQVADMARLSKLAHRLIDGGRLYGYPGLSDAAQKLESAILEGRDVIVQRSLLDEIDQIIRRIESGISLGRTSGYLAIPGPLTKAA